jgi:allophanate hydrolase
MLSNPVQLNSNLGYYTNFMNLLDLSAVAIPSGFYANGMPFGITLFSFALSDLKLLGFAKQIETLGDKAAKNVAVPNEVQFSSSAYQRIAVCGAHMKGLPLNKQLLNLGARFYATARTSASYRFYSLAIAPPERPGLIRDDANGQSIALEIWELPKDRWAEFITNIKSPLCIGSIELDSGQWVYGFLCEPYPINFSTEITHLGGWRNYLQAKVTANL